MAPATGVTLDVGVLNMRTDPYSKLIRTRTGINPNAPVPGQPIITLLHATNVPQMDLLSDSDVYVCAQASFAVDTALEAPLAFVCMMPRVFPRRCNQSPGVRQGRHSPL